MKITDLTEEHKPLYFLCLEDWSEQAREAGSRKSAWYEQFRHKGLRVKLALDDEGRPGGMIQYLPIEQSFVDGKDLYFIYCIWVHGYKEGRGNFQKRGMGSALLGAAEADARAAGVKGIAAWGVWLPFWMKASWFKKHGYKKADRQGLAALLWKPFSADASPPRWFAKKEPPLEQTPGKVTVTAFNNGWCMAQNLVYERAKRAAAEFGDRVVFREIDTSERRNVAHWGVTDEIYIGRKKIGMGPPATYEKLRKLIGMEVKRLDRR